MPTLKEKFLNPNINAENEPQVSFSPRAVSNFARNAFKGLKPENPTNLEEPENSVSSWDMIDSFQAGLGHMGKHIGKTIEDVTRPDDVSIPDWHEQDSFAKRLQDYSEELIRNNSHQYEQNSVPYFLDMAMQSTPEFLTDLGISIALGSALGGPVGGFVGGGANLILKAKKARDLAWAISKAYQGSSNAAKVARAVIPGSAQEAIALESGAVMEAQSEALDAEERYIEKAKADGTYVRGQTEEEARGIYNQVLKDQTAIISAFNVPQYGAIYGKAAKGLLGKAGTLARVSVPEAAEEMSQYADTQYRLDDPLTAQGFIDSGVTGALMGGTMHVAGRGGRYIADRLTGNPTDEQREAAELARKAFSKQNSQQTQNIYGDFRGEVSEALNSSETAARDAYGQAYNEALRDWTRNNDKRQIADDNVHDTIVRIANKYGVPPEKALAVAMIESNGNQDVVSPVGAIGVMQLMPDTARELGVDPYDVEQNIDGGVRYLKRQYDQFGDWDLAFAAYNAGAGTVERYGGVPNSPDYAETQNYVALANDILSTAPDSQGNGQTRGGNIFGVENYDMPREQMESSVEGLKAGWSEVIPQIGGVLKSMGYDPVLTSAARTREHQMRINPDAPNSYHIIQDDGGDAIDISLSEGELTPEQEQAVLDYFKGTGLFNEVLYHSVLGGKHLHLGGLNVEKLRSGQSIQSRADQIFSENFNPNENKLPQWNDYYNDRRKQRQGQQQQRQEDTSQNKSEPPKPLFDLNAEDEQTQKLLEQFATERRNSSTGAQAAQDSVFFEPMFKDGKFQNTPENRAAIMERYGDEFTQWAQPQLQQSQPSQTGQTETNIPPKSEQPNQQTPPKPSNEPLIKAANEFLEKLKAQGGTENIATIFKLQTALDNGDTAAIEKILNQNGNATPSEQAQPQPQEDPIQNNKPPENVLSQPAQQTQENQTPPQLNANAYVQAALVQPIGGTSKAAKDARIEQGKKLTVLADQHGVKIPEPLRISLNNGATKAITEIQKILLDSGKLFNSEPQQVQTPQAQTKFADDLSVAKQEIPEDKNARKSQGESILRVVNFSQNVNSLYPNGNSPIPRIDLPAGLEQALQRGDEKAIRKAQEIIENAGLKIETSPQETAPTTGNTRGNTAEVITGSRTAHQIRYKVVEASDLNSSHTIDNGGVFANENYPSELQPRDRERSDMQAQLISMGNNLNPTDLLDARDVNQGAPVTRQDGVVLNGNGRTAAISYAYEKGKGDPYKNALIQNAEKFGLNADEISKMNQPVLVRELTHSLTDEEMRDLTGTQTGGARMGASEQAQADAAKLSQATLNQFPQGDNVDLSQAESTDFLRAALNDIATPDELNSLTTADGKISQDGINRVRRALFANAYGDKGVVSRMSESTDDNTRNITNALLNAAPTIAKVQAAMKNGTAHNHDLSVIAKAVEKLSTLRDEGKSVSQYLQEQALFPEHADSEELKEILSFFDKNKHAPNKIASFLKNIASRIQNQGDPREENLFGSNEPAPLIDLIKGARRELENNGQQNIFTQEESKSETPKEKFATGKENGNDEPVDTKTDNVVAEKNLTPQQRLIVKFGKMLGTEVVFVDNPDTRFYGVHKGGKTYINVNSKMPLGKVFWHESLHWLRNNNPELYKSLVKAAGITDAQRKAYLDRTKRKDLTPDEVDEEIIADQFQDVAKRTGLLQSIAGKNRGLIQRVVQWLKDTMNKFIDHFRNPTGKLTTKQAQALADEFGRIATQLKDPNGDKIFRYNRRTHNIELADGRDITESAIEEMTRKGAHHPVKLSENENAATEGKIEKMIAKGKKAVEEIIKNHNDIKSAIHRDDIGDIDFLWGKEGDPKRNYKKGYGIAHIIARRNQEEQDGIEVAMLMPEIIMRGEKELNASGVKIKLRYNNYVAVLTNNRDGQTVPHWLLTGFKQYETEPANQRGEGFDSSTPTTRTPTPTRSTRAASSVSNENISQSESDSKPKYSIGASEKPSFFDKAAKKLKKALGIDHDRVRTVEDQRQAHSEAQKKAMDTYLRDPSKENKEKLRALRVTNEQLEAYQNGEEYMNSLGLIQNVGGSPSRVADKNIIFRAFFNLGDKAMDRLIRERDTFMRHYDKAMSLVKSKEDFEQFASLLWLGDTTQQEFTKEELIREGVPENVAEAYTQIRRQIERGYQMADKVQRRAREHAEYLTDEQIDDLHDNKFAYDIKDLNKVDDDGKKLVRWQEYENHVQTVRVTEKALEKLRADDSIQILSEKQLKQGNDKGKYDVKFREGKPTLQHLKGYIPHFFHKYAVVIKDSNGKQIGGILGTGNTEREAIKLADEWLKNHNLESDREIYISPFEFNAEGALGMNSNYAPTVGDKDFNAMLKNIAKNSEMSLAKAKKLLDGSVKLKNRHRFLGQLMQRNGYKGYEKDMAWVLQHHFNSLSRYVALESEFKPQAISLFERVFGAFDKDHSKNLLAQYTKNYINDVNGVPAWIDEVTNKTLNQNPVWRKYFLPVLGERGIQTVAENLTSRIAYLKLGMLNISSAVINYTQLTNAAGYLGSPTQLMKHFGQIAARGGKLTIGEMKILMGSGVAQDIGLDTSSGYDKNRGQNVIPGLDWLGNKSMKLFQNCDSLCRAATALAAYDKAIAEGKTKQQALNYAKEINRKANFSYGVEDAPNAMRRTGAYGKVMLQFYKYPFKQLEVISDFMPTSTRTTFKQKAVFWIPYIFQAGLMGLIPGFDWGDELLNEKFRLFPKDFLQKLCIKGTQEVFGKDSETGKKVAQVMMYGAPALLGADISKRVGLASLMPQDLPSFLLGAASTTIVDGTRGAYNWAMHDEPGVNAVRAISPGLANIYTAAIEGETKDYRGRTVSIYETAWDRILRGMGFRSTDESVAADVQRINFNSRSDRLKDEQRAIDAYIADRSPENLKRLKELHIKPERVKEESRKKKLDRRGRLEQNMTKRERMDNRYLLEFAR